MTSALEVSVKFPGESNNHAIETEPLIAAFKTYVGGQGLSAAQIAVRLGCEPSCMRRWLAGTTKPNQLNDDRAVLDAMAAECMADLLDGVVSNWRLHLV